MTVVRLLVVTFLCLLSAVLPAETYMGLSGELTLPQGGGDMRRLGGAALRVGRYLGEDGVWALEGSVASLEDKAGLAAGALWHWHGCDEFDKLFGYERLDPFFTFGVKGWLADGDIGPYAGLGALYYLSDSWALRLDADFALGLERRPEAVFSLAAGLQFSF